jgi:hypothetical protein
MPLRRAFPREKASADNKQGIFYTVGHIHIIYRHKVKIFLWIGVFALRQSLPDQQGVDTFHV